MKILLTLGVVCITNLFFAQNYTSYFTGSEKGVTTLPLGGSCLMGGATEDDNAMIWFLERANGGDILVLRASGSNGYNDYLYSELGVSVNSVETIVFSNSSASEETYIHEKIANAEGIWFAGGDQWNYVNYWRDTPIQTLVNEAINDRNIVVGGTSAGMAILGSHYFSAENGTITSFAAMNGPFDENLTVSDLPFLEVPYLNEVVTDTHYDDPDRRGRHMTFIARSSEDSGVKVKGIACDEYTAVCIDEQGLAHVYGGYPEYDDNAYFVFANCEIPDNGPEIMEPGMQLTWNQDSLAVKVCKIKGTSNGENTLDLNDWITDTNGEWLNWWIETGDFYESNGESPNCNPLHIDENNLQEGKGLLYPNPSWDGIFYFTEQMTDNCSLLLSSASGEILFSENISKNDREIDLGSLVPGVYIVTLFSDNFSKNFRILIQ